MNSEKFTPIICVDFDGVIHSYSSGWQGVDVIPDAPVPGAIEWLQTHLPVPEGLGHFGDHDGPLVQIYSSRSKERSGVKAMKAWLIKHGLPRQYIDDDILKFPTQKPSAFLTLDDRAICFDGTFPTAAEMLAFKPWNRRTAHVEQGGAGMSPDQILQLKLKVRDCSYLDACCREEIFAALTHPAPVAPVPEVIIGANEKGGLCAAILQAMYKGFQRGDSVERVHAAVMALIQPTPATGSIGNDAEFKRLQFALICAIHQCLGKDDDDYSGTNKAWADIIQFIDARTPAGNTSQGVVPDIKIGDLPPVQMPDAMFDRNSVMRYMIQLPGALDRTHAPQVEDVLNALSLMHKAEVKPLLAAATPPPAAVAPSVSPNLPEPDGYIQNNGHYLSVIRKDDRPIAVSAGHPFWPYWTEKSILATAVAPEWAEYLREGETPLQRLQREIKDSDSLATLLAVEKAKNAAAAPKQADADLMPKRAAFIAWCESRGLDASECDDAWGKREFKHPHIESIWYGWLHAPAVPPQDTSVRDAALEEAARACETWLADHNKDAVDCTYADCDFNAAATDCATAVRALKSSPPAQSVGASEDVQRLAIQFEKVLCAKLGRDWAPSGISVESLLAQLEPAQSVALSDEEIKDIVFDVHAEGGMGEEIDMVAFARAIIARISGKGAM